MSDELESGFETPIDDIARDITAEITPNNFPIYDQSLTLLRVELTLSHNRHLKVNDIKDPEDRLSAFGNLSYHVLAYGIVNGANAFERLGNADKRYLLERAVRVEIADLHNLLGEDRAQKNILGTPGKLDYVNIIYFSDRLKKAQTLHGRILQRKGAPASSPTRK